MAAVAHHGRGLAPPGSSPAALAARGVMAVGAAAAAAGGGGGGAGVGGAAAAATGGFARVAATCAAILNAEGLAGFYTGLAPNMLQVLPSAALSYATYDGVKRALGVP
jgi:hypothetical protein